MTAQEQQTSKHMDRIKGALIGLAVGDALGTSHEFACQKENVYTGLLYIKPNYSFRGHKRTDVVGQYTDDTEMTLCNLRCMIETGSDTGSDTLYNEDKMILYYEKWANTSRAMGKNTRALFHGVKTIKGFRNRQKKVFTEKDVNTFLSNGCLMRCSMFGFIGPMTLSSTDIVKNDCYLTNPNSLCYICCSVHTLAIAYLFHGNDKHDKDAMYDTLVDHVKEFDRPEMNSLGQVDTILSALSDAKNKIVRDISGKTKGYIINALYIAFYGLWNFDCFQDAMDYIVRQKNTDADTNASICGALWGTYLGFEALNKEEKTTKNIDIVLNLDTEKGDNPRPDFCLLKDVDKLVSDFYEVV